METKVREWSSNGLHKKCLEILDGKVTKDSQILVIGSGLGNFEKGLMETFAVLPENITSCDIDPKNFLIPEIQCLQVDANKPLPFNDTQFDIIVCLEVIEHLQDQWNLVSEIKRIKKPQGFAIFSSPNVETIFNKLYFLFTNKLSYFSEADYSRTGHINPLFSWNFKRMLQKNNLKLIHYDSNMFYVWIIPLLFQIKVPFKSILFAQLNIFLIR